MAASSMSQRRSASPSGSSASSSSSSSSSPSSRPPTSHANDPSYPPNPSSLPPAQHSGLTAEPSEKGSATRPDGIRRGRRDHPSRRDNGSIKASLTHPSGRDSGRRCKESFSRHPRRRGRCSSRHRDRNSSSSAAARSKSPGETPSTSMGDSGSSNTSSSQEDAYNTSSTGTTATSSKEGPRQGRHQRLGNGHKRSSFPNKRRSTNRDGGSQDYYLRSNGDEHGRRSHHHRKDHRSTRKHSRGAGDSRERYQGKDPGGRERGKHRNNRHRHRSPESGGDRKARSDQPRRKSERKYRKGPEDRRRTHHSRFRFENTNERRITVDRAGKDRTGAREADMAAPNKVLAGAGEGGTVHDTKELRRREAIRERTMRAIVTVQRIARGFATRNRVAGRRIAVEMLRTACLGVAMEIIEAYIREDVAPDVISDALGAGFEGVHSAVSQRAEAASAANAIMEETAASLIRGLVSMTLTEEADSHLDVVYVRDRRNPLLATVDDLVSEALRVWMREAVTEVVKECAEDFLFGKRISVLVETVLEEGVVEAVWPIASEVYYNAAALASFLEIEEELCSNEARSVVSETIAPFEDQLIELQREKDFAAIQATAQSVIVKGLQLQHAARTVGQRGKLVAMSDIHGKTLNLLLAGRFLAILRAAETNRLQVSASPLLFMLFRRLVVRAGRSVLLDELSRELDRDETALHALELERIDDVDRQRRAGRDRTA
ncbi:unnamed protein product [Ectocarpus sp. 13 AM-2016]